LRAHPVSEEALRPIAELLLTDELVGSGRATRIGSFKLGVGVRGRRKCEIKWQSPHQFSKNAMNAVEGYVTL
jgi:hypothetical protein